MEYSPAASITTTSPLCMVVVIGHVMQHGGVDAAADDGRVGGALAAIRQQSAGNDAGDRALIDAGMDGQDRSLLRFDGGVCGFAQQVDLARVLEGAKRFGQLADVLRGDRVAAAQRCWR